MDKSTVVHPRQYKTMGSGLFPESTLFSDKSPSSDADITPQIRALAALPRDADLIPKIHITSGDLD